MKVSPADILSLVKKWDSTLYQIYDKNDQLDKILELVEKNNIHDTIYLYQTAIQMDHISEDIIIKMKQDIYLRLARSFYDLDYPLHDTLLTKSEKKNWDAKLYWTRHSSYQRETKKKQETLHHQLKTSDTSAYRSTIYNWETDTQLLGTWTEW